MNVSERQQTCPECGVVLASADGVDQHRASEHGVPIFAEFDVACPECGRRYRNLNALSRHRDGEHGDAGDVRPERAPIYYNARDAVGVSGAPQAGSYSEFDYEGAEDELAADDEPLGLIGWIMAGGYMLWVAAKWLLGAAIVVAIVLAALGVFDKESVKEDPNSPGYDFVRELKSDGVIDDFRPVEPEEGWRWEYELDGSVDLRFNEDSLGREELEYEGRRGSIVEGVEEEAKARNYAETDPE